MRNLKKFLALVLAMMMACSLVVTGSAAKWNSAAGDFADQSGVTPAFEEGVAVVTGMKIFEGDDKGDFRPSDTITRAEAAAVVYRLATGDVKVDGKDGSYLWTNVAPFADVTPDKWYAGYVGYLWNAEIIKGANEERTLFNPTEKVTGYEVLAMVLRAMGYDQNDEFTGAGWQIRVGQTANDRLLLARVNTTNYGSGHLNAPARRDTIAEIIFQAATKSIVVYTPAFGYQTGLVQAGLTDPTSSLGRINFGLQSVHGVVVGNQATGESVTKMGLDESAWQYGVDVGSYFYTAGERTDGDDTVTTTVMNFDHATPLNQFGHANKVWYDYNASSGGAGKYHTYAWFDEATKVSTVYVGEGADAATTNIGSKVYEQAKAQGFSLTDVEDALFGSDKYDRMAPILNTLNGYTDKDGNAVDRSDDPVDSNEIHMYALISNSPNNKLDVEISLNAEVAKIYDTNKTDTTERIVLDDGEHGGIVTRGTTGSSAEILVSHLTEDSVRTLGTDVTSWVVDGTADTEADQNLKSWYQTVAVKIGATGTVSTIDANDTVTLSSGQTIEKSRLFGVIRSGVSFLAANDPSFALNAGVSYTFVLDEFGKYLGVTSDPGYSFIYGTFADHSYGNVGSGDLKYLVYGVDANGGKITDHPLTRLREASDAAPGVALAGNGNAFNQIEVARRDYGNTAWGNQVAAGVYRAGIITADGRWYVNDETNTVDGNDDIGVNVGYTTVDKTGDDWTITSGDAAKGFKDVSDPGTVGERLITNDTVFYVVSGTGTATLNVKKYEGMTQFLDGSTEATIDVNYNDPGQTNTYDVAYMTNFDTYHSVGLRDEQNAMITKVFLYENAVTRNSTSTLYYVHDNTATGLQIAGSEGVYAQYELWQGATKSYVWLDTANGAGTPDADTFYTLKKAPVPVVNGQDVYVLDTVTDGVYTAGRSCWENQDIDYFATNNTSTGRIGDAGSETVYGVKDATVVDLTKLSSMHSTCEGVVADGKHDAHNEIKSVNDLFYAISVGYDLKVSIVNTGSNVNLIYVVHVDDAPIGRT